MNNPICNYCHNESSLVRGDVVYPHRRDLHRLFFYYCNNSHNAAYVGCHKNTTIPLGRLADSELRANKSATHRAFDPIWREKFATRSEAYVYLSKMMGVSRSACHIGMFNVSQCIQAQTIARSELQRLRECLKLGYTTTLGDAGALI